MPYYDQALQAYTAHMPQDVFSPFINSTALIDYSKLCDPLSLCYADKPSSCTMRSLSCTPSFWAMSVLATCRTGHAKANMISQKSLANCQAPICLTCQYASKSPAHHLLGILPMQKSQVPLPPLPTWFQAGWSYTLPCWMTIQSPIQTLYSLGKSLQQTLVAPIGRYTAGKPPTGGLTAKS